MPTQDHTPHTHHAHEHAHPHDGTPLPGGAPNSFSSALGWPALLRLLSVAPVVVLLWALVYWANAGAATW